MTDVTIADATTTAHTPTDDEVRQWVKRSMLALTRLLVGPKGNPRGEAFSREVMVIVGGQLPPQGAMWLADVARLNRQHVIHLSPSPDHMLPVIALAYLHGNSVEVAEHCMLCLAPGENRILLVPDSFANGAYGFAANMKLKRRKAPASFAAATANVKRAYDRYFELHAAAPGDDWEPLRFKMQ